MNDRHPFDEGILLEDLDKEFPDETVAPKATSMDLAAMRLEGDNIPEDLRGKSVESLLTDRARMESLMKEFGSNMNRPTPVAVTAVEPDPVYDRTAVKELLENGNVMEAMEAMMGYAYKRVSKDFETRIAPLVSTTNNVAESAMRAKYPAEFELFGPQIAELARNAGQGMSNPESWDNLIAFVRGRGDNFDKLVEYKATKRNRANSASEFPPSVSSGALRGPSSGNRDGVKATKEELSNDPAVQKMLRASGMTIDEYYRWF